MQHRIVTGILIILLLLTVPFGVMAAQPKDSQVSLLVRFSGQESVSGRLSSLPTTVQVHRVIRPLHIFDLRVNAAQVDQVIARLAARPDVLYVERDGQMTGMFTPNDPGYSSNQYAPQHMNMPTAWDYTTGSGNVIIAVVDSGVSPDHPEFSGRILPGYDFVNDDNDPSDDQGHGTHVAGIAAASINNGIGLAGICGACKILPVKVLNQYNVGNWSDIAAGITYAADHGAKVINLSLGGTGSSQAVHDAVQYATEKGALVVAAAGNDGADEAFYPATYTETLAVAATDTRDGHWSLSNYGAFVDVAAPGVSIYSTLWSADAGNTYGFKSGTSMATPAVSGLAGLLFSQNSSRTNQDVRQLIIDSAQDLGDPGWDPYFGYGLVDGGRALAAGAGASVGSISGMTYNDGNGNGQHDATETTPVSNVSLHLLDQNGQTVATVISGNDGTYYFANVTAGTYQLDLDTPSGLYATTSHPVSVTVGGGEAVTGLDFGLIAPTSVSLLSLQAKRNREGVTIRWRVMGDDTGTVYLLQRGQKASGPWSLVGQVEGTGYSQSYALSDRMDGPGVTAWYRLLVQSPAGQSVIGPIIVKGMTPTLAARTFIPAVWH